MLGIVVNQREFRHIAAGELIEIFKEQSEYYEHRFLKYFGVIGEENNIREISILKSCRSYKKGERKIASCTVRREKGVKGLELGDYKKVKKNIGNKPNYSDVPITHDRFVLEIMSLRDFDPDKDSALTAKKDFSMDDAIVVNNLKKKELCMKRKGSLCDQNCSECDYNVTESVFLETLETAMALLNIGIQSDYKKGYHAGYMAHVEEEKAYENLEKPREVIYTEGYEPYCQVCRSATKIYAKDGTRNVFCGRCGTLLDWGAVSSKEDNYERIKNASESAHSRMGKRVNYLKRRRAIEEYSVDMVPRSIVMKEVPEPPIEALKNKSKLKINEGETKNNDS